MNGTQEVLLRMYKDIKAVLDRHGIRYYAYFGTAVGAVRHNGFIPWDDDLDLAVWLEDIPEINRVLSAELDRSLYYYHIPRGDDHPHVISLAGGPESIRDRTAVFIDLFPLAGYPSGAVRRAFTGMSYWLDMISTYIMDHTGSGIVWKFFGFLHRASIPLAEISRGKNCDYITVECTKYKDSVCPKKLFEKSVMFRFEDTEIPLPSEYHAVLTGIYGDYMTPPPEAERAGATGFPLSAYRDWLIDSGKL